MTLPADELLQRPPRLKPDGTYDPLELDRWFQKLYLLLGKKGKSESVNIPDELEKLGA